MRGAGGDSDDDSDNTTMIVVVVVILLLLFACVGAAVYWKLVLQSDSTVPHDERNAIRTNPVYEANGESVQKNNPVFRISGWLFFRPYYHLHAAGCIPVLAP